MFIPISGFDFVKTVICIDPIGYVVRLMNLYFNCIPLFFSSELIKNSLYRLFSVTISKKIISNKQIGKRIIFIAASRPIQNNYKTYYNVIVIDRICSRVSSEYICFR